MPPLVLTEKQLIKIGFKKKIHPAMDEFNPEIVSYEIEFINGAFYYNLTRSRWYQRTDICDCSNSVELRFRHASELFTMLGCFGIKHTFFII